MSSPSITLAGQELILLPERAIFWENKEWLLLADVHLGKAAHFRKHGSAVPSGKGDFETLASLIKTWSPEKVIFLGDLFHSSRNADWDRLCDFTRNQPCDFVLIRGNHDLLSEQDYIDASLEVIPEELIESGLVLRHDPTEGGSAEGYELAGHIHPGVRLEGEGRQRLRLPCFAFGKRQGLLPAFGEFTGLAIVEPVRYERLFVIAESAVIELDL